MTRTAKNTTDTQTAPAPTKKATAARKTPAAKRATPAKPRTPRPRTRKATGPALSLVKENTTADKATVVDLRHPLKTRRRLFAGPWGPTEQAAIRAALDSARLRLPVPVSTWNGSTAQLADGTLLIHNPGPDRYFTAHIACPHGAIHGWPITTYRDLAVARGQAAECDTTHAEPSQDPDGIETELDWHTAITRGVAPVAQPKPSAVFQLREGVRRAEAAKADTQPLQQERALADTLAHSSNATDETHPMSLDDIAEGLAARAAEQSADTDQPKEHPQP